MRTKIIGLAFAAAMVVATAVPLVGTGTAEAHPGHRSCRGYGDAVSSFNQANPPGALGAARSAWGQAGIMDDQNAAFHAALCDPAP